MEVIKANGQTITITHGSKLMFPEAGITKQELVDYYHKISDYMLPFLKDRAITIQCFPQGIDKAGYIRQHSISGSPEWFKTANLKKKDGSYMAHNLCQDTASLVYLANQNTIAIHRWLSKIDKPNYPDVLVIDLDPPEGRFDLARKGAKLLREEISKIKHQAFVMTTGSKGLHVLIPMKAKLDFEKATEFLSKIIQPVMDNYPDEFCTEIQKVKRANRVYFDILRNAYGQTAITPYSVRALKEASVATPLFWEELDDPKLFPGKYTIRNIFNRIKTIKKPFWGLQG
jgi:bifunctional non-homologous end joining protein LigD